jgi:hypothetical protein
LHFPAIVSTLFLPLELPSAPSCELAQPTKLRIAQSVIGVNFSFAAARRPGQALYLSTEATLEVKAIDEH